MKNTTTYTSTIPIDLIKLLNNYAKKFNIPKSKIIEKAIRAYLEKLKKAEYVRSFQYANKDEEIINMAEEGLEDYLKIIENNETR